MIKIKYSLIESNKDSELNLYIYSQLICNIYQKKERYLQWVELGQLSAMHRFTAVTEYTQRTTSADEDTEEKQASPTVGENSNLL